MDQEKQYLNVMTLRPNPSCTCSTSYTLYFEMNLVQCYVFKTKFILHYGHPIVWTN